MKTVKYVDSNYSGFKKIESPVRTIAVYQKINSKDPRPWDFHKDF